MKLTNINYYLTYENTLLLTLTFQRFFTKKIKFCSALNIHILELTQCPYYWPNHELCVKIQFAIPIFVDESDSEWSGYQLKSDHLEQMWSTYSSHHLSFYGLSEYQQPDNNYTLLVWSLSILGVIVLFSVALCVIRYINIKFSAPDKYGIKNYEQKNLRVTGGNLILTEILFRIT